MSGEYGLAQRLIDEGIAAAQQDGAMDPSVLTRAMMTQLIEVYKRDRSVPDIVSELEQHIRLLRDGDDIVVGRGE